MNRRDRRLARLAAAAGLAALGCAPIEDAVFAPLTLETGPPLVVIEGAGAIEIPVSLNAAPSVPVTLEYRAVGTEAQLDCQVPDFEAPAGRIVFEPGERSATVELWVNDDDLAETDERLELVFEGVSGLPDATTASVEIVINDNDRTGLLDARDFGVMPGAPGDQAPALASALDAAAALGRGVLVLAPGVYEVGSVTLPAGVTLSARGVTWYRPLASDPNLISLRIAHTGPEDSASSLVEGIVIDGRRDQQGPYRDNERDAAHLIDLFGDSEGGGRVRATIERVTLLSGTASGVWVGPDSDVTVCELTASELWRDAITAVGGNSRVSLRNVDATASEGTGLWLGVRNIGHEGSVALEVDAENVWVGAGDVELEAGQGTNLQLRQLIMTSPPFRLDAPGGVVRIADSVLMMGLPSELHNYFGLPHDVEISGTTLVASESADTGMLAEEPRALSAVSLATESMATTTPDAGSGSLIFAACRFELASDVEPDDSVYAIQNADPNVSVVVRGGVLGAGFVDWFAPGCSACSFEP